MARSMADSHRGLGAASRRDRPAAGCAWGRALGRPSPRPGTSLGYFLQPLRDIFAGFFAAFLALAVFSFFDFFAWSAREARA